MSWPLLLIFSLIGLTLAAIVGLLRRWEAEDQRAALDGHAGRGSVERGEGRAYSGRTERQREAAAARVSPGANTVHVGASRAALLPRRPPLRPARRQVRGCGRTGAGVTGQR